MSEVHIIGIKIGAKRYDDLRNNKNIRDGYYDFVFKRATNLIQ